MKRIVVILLVVLSLALAGCWPLSIGDQGNMVRGSGKVVSETRPVSGFTSVAVMCAGDVKITQGDTDSLVIEAEDNILPLLVSEVNNGQLVLKTKPNTSYNTTRPVRFTITVKDLWQISSSASGDVQAGDIKTSTLDLALSGSADVTLGSVQATSVSVEANASGTASLASLQANLLSVEINGSGNVEIKGGAATQSTVNMHSSGNFTAPNLESQTAVVTVSGSGTATLWAKTSLTATLSGSGNVDYFGSPAVSQNVSGSGRVRSRGNK